MNGFEKADQAFEQSLNSKTDDSNQESSSHTREGFESSEGTEHKSVAQQLIELDKLEKVLFGGKEYTPEQFRKGMMFHSDYTKKTQEIAEERKYYDALQMDLEELQRDPSLLDAFKKLYPEKLHKLGDMWVSAFSKQAQAKATEATPAERTSTSEIPKEIQDKLDFLEKEVTASKTEKFEQMLNLEFDKALKQYPKADETSVLAALQHAHTQGKSVTPELIAQFFKQSHEKQMKAFESWQAELVKNQKEANQKARDTKTGGGPVGNAPRKEGFDQATERAVRELGGR